MSKYSEYSRLRSIARKRGERMAEAGYTKGIQFPTVKELKAGKVSYSAAMKNVEAFLNAATTVREYKKVPEAKRPVLFQSGPSVIVTTQDQEKKERRKAQNRQSAARYRERVRSLSKQERSYMKAAKTLGLHITPSQAKAFGEYMDYRFAQGSDSVHYRIARYVEDYVSIIAKRGYKNSEIINDFNSFLLNRQTLSDRAYEMAGYTPEEIDDLFEGYIDEL